MHFTFAWYSGLTALFYSDRNCIVGLLQIPIESKWNFATGFKESWNGFCVILKCSKQYPYPWAA